MTKRQHNSCFFPDLLSSSDFFLSFFFEYVGDVLLPAWITRLCTWDILGLARDISGPQEIVKAWRMKSLQLRTQSQRWHATVSMMSQADLRS